MVDLGVGSDRWSIVCLIELGYYIIIFDNGFLSYIKYYEGIKKVIEIDEVKSWLFYLEESYIFYGRDVYVYNGVRLVVKKIVFESFG